METLLFIMPAFVATTNSSSEILLNKGAKDDAVQIEYYNSLNLNIHHLLKGIVASCCKITFG
jgi:hypothetical protein